MRVCARVHACADRARVLLWAHVHLRLRTLLNYVYLCLRKCASACVRVGGAALGACARADTCAFTHRESHLEFLSLYTHASTPCRSYHRRTSTAKCARVDAVPSRASSLTHSLSLSLSHSLSHKHTHTHTHQTSIHPLSYLQHVLHVLRSAKGINDDTGAHAAAGDRGCAPRYHSVRVLRREQGHSAASTRETDHRQRHLMRLPMRLPFASRLSPSPLHSVTAERPCVGIRYTLVAGEVREEELGLFKNISGKSHPPSGGR